jgi:soluble lytic murein transglycosylase
MSLVPLLSLLLLLAQDPRPQLVDLQKQHQAAQALGLADQLLDQDAEGAHELGVEYLRGRLLERLDRRREAVSAYAAVLRHTPSLRPWALFAIAENEIVMGHPELAAGLLTAMLKEPVPKALRDPALRALDLSLRQGGDCRVLADSDFRHLPDDSRRYLRLLAIDCRLAANSYAGAMEGLVSLLEQDTSDLPAHHAAEHLSVLAGPDLSPESAALVGASLHHQRDFERAARYLSAASEHLSPGLSRRGEFETQYRLVRSWFWSGDLERAAQGFLELAERTGQEAEKARSLYQRARSLELNGLWQDASASYRLAYLADPNGRFSGASLLSAMRIEWRSAKEETASELANLLPTQRGWRRESGQAHLFLASSDVVRGRADRAGRWLDQVDLSLGRGRLETTFWRARLAELEGSRETAVRRHFEVLVASPHHLLAEASRQRLRRTELRGQARSIAEQLSDSGQIDDLAAAWLVLGDADPAGARARRALVERLERNRSARTFLSLGPAASDDWPIWGETLTLPEEKLLALGLWSEGNRFVLRHFPISQPALAMAASSGLAEAGNTRRSLYVAEILRKRISTDVQDSLLPKPLRELFYPFPYRSAIEDAAERHGVDPHLLLAIFREESRFDPEAVSPASARGLGQFILPTAQRLGRDIGLGTLEPRDLHDPETSIELGGAYLAELHQRFEGATHQAVAAYNAGEAQATLWQSHCYSREAAEFYTKVGFPETRNYLSRVLTARHHYAEIYGGGAPSSLLGTHESSP